MQIQQRNKKFLFYFFLSLLLFSFSTFFFVIVGAVERRINFCAFFQIKYCYFQVNRCLTQLKAAVVLTAFNATRTIRHDGFLWSIPKTVILYCHCGAWQIISLPLTKGLASSHFDPDALLTLRNEKRRNCAAIHHMCSLSLGFKEVRFNAEQPVLFAFSWRLIYLWCFSCLCHSYTAAKEMLTSTEAGRCADDLSLSVCFWGREIETGMTHGCLKSERKHSPALSSH